MPVGRSKIAFSISPEVVGSRCVSVSAVTISVLLGEMGEETVLASQRVVARRLLENGFKFRFPTLEEALWDAGVGRPAAAGERR